MANLPLLHPQLIVPISYQLGHSQTLLLNIPSERASCCSHLSFPLRVRSEPFHSLEQFVHSRSREDPIASNYELMLQAEGS